LPANRTLVRTFSLRRRSLILCIFTEQKHRGVVEVKITLDRERHVTGAGFGGAIASTIFVARSDDAPENNGRLELLDLALPKRKRFGPYLDSLQPRPRWSSELVPSKPKFSANFFIGSSVGYKLRKTPKRALSVPKDDSP